jgi:integrase
LRSYVKEDDMGCVWRSKGRNVWMLKYRDLTGKVHRESSGSTDKEEAKKILRKKDHLTDQGVLVTPEVGKVKFKEAIELLVDYHEARDRTTKKIEGRIAKHLTPFFGPNRLLVTITSDTVTSYIAHRKKDKPTPTNATINRELAWLKQMFTIARREGKLMTGPHIEMLRENNARQGFFEPDQIAEVLAKLPDDLKSSIEFAFLTGWRIKSEVLSRQWRHIDFKRGTVRLEPGEAKNDEPREIFMTKRLREILEAQKTRVDDLKAKGVIVPWVFFRMVAEKRKGPKKPKPITSLTKAFKRACREAGYPGRIPHDLRRSAVRQFIRQGIPERVAMKLTGHKTASVFHRYDIVSEGDLRDAAQKLDTARG